MKKNNSTIGIITGTRPNFTKIYPLIKLIKKKKLSHKFCLIHTNQHYSKDLIFEFKKIFDSEINFIKLRKNKKFEISSCIKSLIKIYQKLSLKKVLIIGDSDSTLCGAIAAKRLFLKLYHIESGLRSFKDMHEEFNRISCSSLSDVCFAPSLKSFKYLKHISKKTKQKVLFTGDLNYENYKSQKIKTNLKHKLDNNKYILLTLHRRENILSKEKLSKIFFILNTLAKKYKIYFYCHPHTKLNIKKFNIKVDFKILTSLPNSEILKKISNASLVITDSGGLQKEAFYCRKFCVILRNNSEWVELSNLNSLIGYNFKLISKFIENNFDKEYKGLKNPYYKKNNLNITLKELIKNG